MTAYDTTIYPISNVMGAHVYLGVYHIFKILSSNISNIISNISNIVAK